MTPRWRIEGAETGGAIVSVSSAQRTLPAAAMLASVLIAPGCDLLNGGAERPDAPSMVLQVAVDKSGSYREALPGALSLTCELAHQLRQGDRIAARWLTSSSYSARHIFYEHEIPETEEAGGFGTVEAVRESRKRAAALDSLRREACEELPDPADVSRSQESDVMGALAAAAISAQADPRPIKVVLLSSDLEETVASGQVRGFLHGVHVLIATNEMAGGSLADHQRRLQQWRERLVGLGAASARVLPLGESPGLQQLRVDLADSLSSRGTGGQRVD